MIRKQRAIEIYQDLQTKTNLSSDWKIDFNKDSRSLGKCYHNNKTIAISTFLLNSCSEAELIDTILHEIAHAFVGYFHFHDEIWKAKAREIGCTAEECGSFNPNGSRASDKSEQRERIHIPPLSKQCPYCGKDAFEENSLTLNGIKWSRLKCGHITQQDLIKGVSYNSWESQKGYRPYKYQLEGLEFIRSSGARCLIADEMGLGKTIQALGFLKFHPEISLPCLWICKTTLKMQSIKESLEWCGPEYFPCTIDSSKSYIFPNMKMYVISMDLLRRINPDKLKELGIKTIVADEIQHFKNPDSSRTQELRALVSNVNHFIALSGTPWKNRGSEYFSILNMLRPEIFPNYNDFQAKWVKYYMDPKTGKMKAGGINRLDEFKEKTKDFVIRRMRDDVLPDLPKINRQIRYVELEKVYGDSYEKAEAEVAAIIQEAVISGRENQAAIAGEIMRLKHITGLAKVDAIVEDTIEFLEDTETWQKITIGIHHIDVGDRIEAKLNEYLQANGFNSVIRLKGGENPERRNQKQENFKQDERNRVMILSTLAGGEGLNLQFCQNAIQGERQWNPGNEEQFEMRFSRPLNYKDYPKYLQEQLFDSEGVPKLVSIRFPYVICSGTVDEIITEIIERKRFNFLKSMNDRDREIEWNDNDIMQELQDAILRKRATYAVAK